MNKDEYTKYYSSERLISKIMGFILPMGMFAAILASSTITDKQTFGIISQVIPFLYLPIFWIVYYVKPFGFAIPTSSKFYFEKMNFEKLAIRHGLLQQLYGGTAKFLIYSILFSATLWYLAFLTQNQENDVIIKFHNFLLSVIFLPAMMIFSMRFVTRWITDFRDYNFYLSKAYFMLALHTEFLDEVYRFIWILNGLYAYNRYIRKNMYSHIGNLEAIYSKFISISDQTLNQLLQTILDKLENREKLDLLRYLLSMDENNNKKVIIPPLGWRTKMKDILPYAIPAISVIITVIQLIKK